MSETSEETAGSGTPEFLKNPRLWVGLVIAVLAIAFIAQNRDSVSFDLLMLTFQAPQWLTLTIIFLAGLVTGVLVSRRRARSKKKK